VANGLYHVRRAATAVLTDAAVTMAAELVEAEARAARLRQRLQALAMTWVSDGGRPRPIQMPAAVVRVLQDGPPALPRASVTDTMGRAFEALVEDAEATL